MPRGRNDQCSVNTTYDLHRTIEGNWFRFLVSRPKCAGLSAVYLKISTVGEAVGLGQYLFSNSIEWKEVSAGCHAVVSYSNNIDVCDFYVAESYESAGCVIMFKRMRE